MQPLGLVGQSLWVMVAGGCSHGNGNLSLSQGSSCLHLLPVHSPGLPARPRNPQPHTGMGMQSRRQPHAGLFCFSAAEQLGLTGMGFASVAALPGALAWCGMVQVARSPQWHSWEGLGVPAPQPEPLRAMPVPSWQQLKGSRGGIDTGGRGDCGSSISLLTQSGVMAVGWGAPPKWQLLVQPSLAWARLCLEETGEVVRGE